MKIHPRAACGIFVFLFCVLAIVIGNNFNINFFNRRYTYIILGVLIFFVNFFFAKKYYSEEDDENQ